MCARGSAGPRRPAARSPSSSGSSAPTGRPSGCSAWAEFADQAGRPARLMAIDRDVTPERAAEAERERLLEQEREAWRLSEAFFGVMSHELRTPVTTIIAGSRLLGRSTTLDPGDAELVEDIAFEANRLHRLIDDLLVLSRVERGNLRPVSRARARRPPRGTGRGDEQRRWPETTFRTSPSTSHEVIDGEETYVEQVLRNLLSNAAKYSPVGTEVDVVVERAGDEVIVRVLDQGIGRRLGGARRPVLAVLPLADDRGDRVRRRASACSSATG